MRILVISDIHANLTALEAVLSQAAGEWDYVWCLGDVVGYGPDPNECMDRLRELPHRCLLGNHDWAAIHGMDIHHFNEDARISLQWTQEELRADNAEYLRSLTPMLVVADFTLAHGSPREPIWEYIMEPTVAACNFAHFETPYCLVGHTHMPAIFEHGATEGSAQSWVLDSDSEHFLRPQSAGTRFLRPQSAGTRFLQPQSAGTCSLNGSRLILNPGSVGQPRDANPAAAYALLDTEAERWQQRRADYAIHEVQERMRAHNLPERLAQRLTYGW